MNSIETQKLGYVAYPVIIGEIQNLAEILIGLSDEGDDFSSRRELLLKTEGIAVNRFAPIGGEKPDLISIKIYNESKYVSLIENLISKRNILLFIISIRPHHCERGGFECKNSTITHKFNEYAKIQRL